MLSEKMEEQRTCTKILLLAKVFLKYSDCLPRNMIIQIIGYERFMYLELSKSCKILLNIIE